MPLWEIKSYTTRPIIKATIETDLWNLTTKAAVDSNLYVLQNTLLTLICIANYPVFWKKGKERIPQEQLFCYSDGGKEICSNSTKDTLPMSDFFPNLTCTSNLCSNPALYINDIPVIIEEYRAVIKYRATTRIEGTYTCNGTRIYANTSAHIMIRQRAATSHPQLLQGGFKKMYNELEWAYLIDAEELEKKKPDKYLQSFIYAFPRGEIYAPILRCANDPKISYPYQTKLLITEDLSSTVVKVAFSILYGCNHRQFVIKDGSETEVLKEDFDIEDPLNSMEPVHVDTQEMESGALLTEGHVYGVTVELGDDFQKGLLVIDETNLVYNPTEKCWPNDTSIREETPERCGFIAITTQSAEHAHNRFLVRAVLLILNATRPCIFTIKTNIDYTASKILRIRVAIAEKKYFGSLSELDSAAKVLSSNPVEVFNNQTLHLQCLIPICHYHVFVFWCQGESTCKWELVGRFEEMLEDFDIFHDPDIKVVYEKLDTYTMVTTLTFHHIQVWQEGLYYCASFNVYSSPPISSLKAVNNVKVKDRHLSIYGADNDKHIELKQNEVATLDCEVNGQPTPNISWSCSRQSMNVTCPTGFRSTNSDPNSLSIQVNQSGIYICTATNEFGTTSRIYNVTEIFDQKSRAQWPLMVILPILFLFLASLIFLLIDRRRRSRRLDISFKELADLLNSAKDFHLDNAAPLNNQASLLPYDRHFEIDLQSFTIKAKLLGDGEFGCIYKGELIMGTPATSTVAVKIPKDPSNPYHHRALLDELRIMCHIRPHVNVLSLVGACTTGIEKRQLFILTEFCDQGSLKDYLTENRTDFEAIGEEDKSVKTLLNFAYQAANGMVHLAAEKIIHRDLALRNLLLAYGCIVKIADFGMSRKHESVYLKALSADVPIPLFWMALESLLGDLYTEKSDVWSFGIVLWEMFNCGRRPYPDHEPDMAFRSWLRASEENRMGPPKIACQEIYHLMRECWKVEPAARPTFSQCKRQIAETLEKRSSSTYITVIRTLSEANLNMARNQQTLSSRNNWLESQSQRISPMDSADDQSECVRDQCSIQLKEINNKGQGAEYVQNEGQIQQSTSVDDEIHVIVDAAERKVSARPYVAATT